MKKIFLFINILVVLLTSKVYADLFEIFAGGEICSYHISEPKDIINNGVGFTAGIRKTIILDLFARISYEIDVCTVKTEIDYDINNSYETYNHNIALGIGYPFIIGEGHAVIIEVGEIYTSWTMYYFNEHAGIAGVYPAYKTKESISNNNFIPFIRIGWLAKIGIEFEYRFGDNKNVPSSYAIFILLAIN